MKNKRYELFTAISTCISGALLIYLYQVRFYNGAPHLIDLIAYFILALMAYGISSFVGRILFKHKQPHVSGH